MTKITAMNQVPNAGITAQTGKTRAESIGCDFDKIMSREKSKVQQPKQNDKTLGSEKKIQKETNMTDQSSINKAETKENQKPAIKEVDTGKHSDEKDTSKIIENFGTDDSIDEEVENAIENGIMNILEQMQELLNVSSKELLQTMEELEMQPIDLLNVDNVSKLLLAVMGEESQMGFVTDENMYDTLQEMTQIVENQNEAVQTQTGLGADELEVVMEKLKMLEEQQALQSDKLNENIADAVNALDINEDLYDMKSIVTLQESADWQEDIVSVTVQNKAESKENISTENEVEQIQRIDSENLETEKSSKGGNREEQSFAEKQNQFAQNQSLSETTQGEIIKENADSFTTDLPSTESILKQIADSVKIQKGKELTEMELQLHPASLGNVKVHLTTRGGSVTAQFTAETETVKNAIESQVVQLKESLQEQGIKVDAVEVSVASHQMERNLDKEGKGQQNSEENNKTDKIQRLRRVSINLNQLETDEDLETSNMADDATMIAMDMMKRNGSSMDLLA